MEERWSVNRRQFLRGALGVGAALSLPALLTACGSTPGTQAHGGSLSVGIVGGGTSDTLDPNMALNNADWTRLTLLFGALVVPDANNQLVYSLAEEISPVDSEGRVWILRVREATFHDGSPVTADDVIASFARLYDPARPAAGASILPQLDPATIEKLDERTVRIPLTEPVSVLPELLSPQYFPITPVNFDPDRPIGAGPFKFESFDRGNRSVFTRFDNYVGGAPALAGIEIVNMADNAAMVNALLAKQISAAIQVPAPHLPRLEEAGYRVIRTPGISSIVFTMRTDIPPFNDARVREAFRLIVDREKMVEQVYLGRATVGNDLYGTVDPGVPTDLPQRMQDIDRAKILLAEAGYENLEIDLYTAPIGTDWIPAALAFAEDAKAAGVKINVNRIDIASWNTQHYLQDAFGQDFYPQQPYLLTSGYSTQPDSPFNSTYVADDEYNSLYQQALMETELDARNELIARMARIDHERGANIIPALQDNFDVVPADLMGLINDGKFFRPLNNFLGIAKAQFT